MTSLRLNNLTLVFCSHWARSICTHKGNRSSDKQFIERDRNLPNNLIEQYNALTTSTEIAGANGIFERQNLDSPGTRAEAGRLGAADVAPSGPRIGSETGRSRPFPLSRFYRTRTISNAVATMNHSSHQRNLTFLNIACVQWVKVGSQTW